MSFDNLIEIIEGTLLNTPAISRFASIETDSKKTKWGDLFVALDQKDIDEALANGAYGILCDYETDIKDEEIAWIRVDDIEKSLKKLLRFKLLKESFRFIYLDTVEMDIIKSMTKNTNFIYLDHDISENFKKIINANHENIIFSDDKTILNEIYPNFTQIKSINNTITITYKTLFTSNIIYKDHYYEDLKLPPLFIDSLHNVLEFLSKENIEYDLNRVSLENHFNPIFITDKFKIKNFGDSEHVIIVEEHTELIQKELEFIKVFAKWSKYVHLDIKDLTKANIDKFNFILIEANYNEVIKFLENFSTQKSPSLFMEL